MNFDTLNKNPCVALPGQSGSGSGPTPNDPRCSDSDFAAANPMICGSSPYLILKPESSLILKLASVQFNVFEYQNGVESQLDSDLLFTCSDPTVFSIGASSGSGTGLAPGQVTVSVSWQGLTASATLTVLDPATGCNSIVVASAVVIDQSRSMSLSFSTSPITGLQFGAQSKLNFAQSAAYEWANNIAKVNGQPKDSVKIWSFGDTPIQATSDYSQSPTELLAAITNIQQLLAKTDISAALTAAINDISLVTSDEKVILLISDGQQTDPATAQSILDAASAFKATGGIIICIGVRAYGTGFDLLDRVASGGFFINAVASTAVASLGGLTYIKSAVCAGACVPSGDIFVNTAELDYSSFLNWEVIAGQVNLLGNGLYDYLPGNGLYVQLASSNNAATMRTIDSFSIQAGLDYTLAFNVAGNNQQNIPDANQAVMVYIRDINSAPTDPNLFQQVVTPNWNDLFAPYSLSFTAAYSGRVKIYVQQIVATGYTGTLFGNIFDNVTFTEASTMSTLFSDNFDAENPVYIPPGCGPSAVRTQTDNPPALGFTFIPFAGSNFQNGDQYFYAISYVTDVGETAKGPIFNTFSVSDQSMPNMAAKLTMPIPTDSNVIEKRLWRNIADGDQTLFLLAVFAPDVPNYIDVETNTVFSERADTSHQAPNSNTTGKTSGQLGSGISGCYAEPCQPAVALGGQFADPAPLPDIETGTTPPTLYTSSQTQCASCTNGVNMTTSTDGLVPSSYDDTSTPKTIIVEFTAVTLVSSYQIGISNTAASLGAAPNDFHIDGSNDGLTWVTIDTQSGLTWVDAEIKTFSLLLAGTFSNYRMVVTSPINATFLNSLMGITLFGYTAGPAQVCKTSSATSYVSQSDADSKASAAALQSATASLNCVTQYTSTQSYTASCAVGSLGSPVTMTSNASSFVSQADADSNALAAAKALAIAALNCNGSNNTQQIVINDVAAATPYPSVKFVSGLTGNVTKVTVQLKNFQHTSPQDVKVLLISPSGTQVLLQAHCGGTNTIPVNPVIGPFVTLTFDDSAGSSLTQSGTLTTGTFKPTRFGAIASMEPPCPAAVPPSPPYYTTLAQFIGEVGNGSWSLWVDDDAALNVGQIVAGWDLTITSA